MLGTRKRNIDPIDTLDVVSGLTELLDCIKDHLEEAYRGLAFFKRARISDQGNNDDFCFLSLKGVYCSDANLYVPQKLYQHDEVLELDGVTDVSRDLNLDEAYVINC